MVKSNQLGIVDEDSFYLFLNESYVIMCHIISLGSFSVKFQLRCAEFMNQTLCHRGELGFLTTVSENDFFRKIDMDSMPIFLNSDFSLVAQNVELSGYFHYFFDIETLFLDLTPEDKKGWMVYAILYFYSKNCEDLELPELFNNPVSDINYDDDDNDENMDDIKIDSKIFDQFEFGESSIKIFNFLNVIYREIYRHKDSLQKFYDESYQVTFTKKFPLFKQQNHEENGEENMYEDFLLILQEDKIKWLIKESAKKVCFYWFLAATMVAPDLNETRELRDFLDETEKENVLFENNDEELEKIFISLIKKIEKKSKCGCINVESSKCNTNTKPNIFTYIINEGRFAYFKYVTNSNWTVFQINREYVKSIWTSQCQDVIGFGNSEDSEERSAVQENNNFLHNLIIQISDIPIEYPAYVSGIEDSFSTFNYQ
ncbi:Pecanex-like protein 4 [Tritrichomonas musculus]|uniref:Pecanex-like protein 4 n=1 Tax=Tritrichomonas musculus TaxID=1915356 RepID=A0ABR2HE64_9EUKA